MLEAETRNQGVAAVPLVNVARPVAVNGFEPVAVVPMYVTNAPGVDGVAAGALCNVRLNVLKVVL